MRADYPSVKACLDDYQAQTPRFWHLVPPDFVERLAFLAGIIAGLRLQEAGMADIRQQAAELVTAEIMALMRAH